MKNLEVLAWAEQLPDEIKRKQDLDSEKQLRRERMISKCSEALTAASAIDKRVNHLFEARDLKATDGPMIVDLTELLKTKSPKNKIYENSDIVVMARLEQRTARFGTSPIPGVQSNVIKYFAAVRAGSFISDKAMTLSMDQQEGKQPIAVNGFESLTASFGGLKNPQIEHLERLNVAEVLAKQAIFLDNLELIEGIVLPEDV